MAVNKNMSRWIWASVTKYFDDNKAGLVVFFEGDDRDTAKDQDFIEFRMDGPRTKELSHNYTQYDVFVNVLVQSTMNKEDTHKFWRALGQVQALFIKCIPVIKYGDGPDDDGTTQVGTLLLQDSGFNGEQVKTAVFGQVDPIVRVQQATVEANYRMHLSE